ncbi:MAG TPA: M1 family aminopeptidase [Candidatus Acidoferrales bacterium]
MTSTIMALFSSMRRHGFARGPKAKQVRHTRSWSARHVVAAFGVLLLACCATMAQAPARPQTAAAPARRPAFRAVSYDVYASLSPADQTLAAKATVEFEAREASRIIECELHSNLRVSEVRDASGRTLEFGRDDTDPLLVRVTLSDPVPAGQRIKLTFAYAGLLANEEGSPVPGVRLAWIGNAGAYLLLPGRWFPLTGYPSNRYNAVFHIEVPQNFTVAGTGTPEGSSAPGALSSSAVGSSGDSKTTGESKGDSKTGPALLGNRNPGGETSGPPAIAYRNGAAGATSAQAPAQTPTQTKKAGATNNASVPSSAATSSATPIRPLAAPPAGPRTVYTFRSARPEAAGTFVAGSLQLYPVKAEGLNISVYAPAGAAAAATPYGEAAARIAVAFSDQFGPLVDPNLTVAQIPDGTLASFSAPGLLLLSQHQWTETVNSRLLSNLVAAQWWGNQVMSAEPSDTWLTDGLARYSEALYVEQADNKESMNKALEDFAVGSLMYEGSAPIAEANRITPFSSDYTSVVVNKGAMVFHMLRGQMGDAPFFSLLRDFSTQFSGKAASLADFEKMAADRAAKLSSNAASASPTGGFVLRNSSGADAAAGGSASGAPGASSNEGEAGAVNLRGFFAQWLHSTGVPEFSLNYTIYRTQKGFKIVGKVKQNLDFFHMPVEIEVQTEGNPEFKTVDVTGTESSFDVDVFGRPKPDGIILDPHNYILKSSARLHVRAIIARGEALAEQGRYYDAVQQYSQALDVQKNNSLAEFRTGEAFFYQKNYSAAANAFRDALEGDLDPSYKWVEVWSHIYLGKIYDIAGDRTRAVNEYSKAQQTNDDTGGAQGEVKKYLSQPFSEGSQPA